MSSTASPDVSERRRKRKRAKSSGGKRARAKPREEATPARLVDGRCWWATSPIYVAYHDDEWGRYDASRSDAELFGWLSLEGFQSGLSWLTILKKRENFRRAFDNFEIATVAGYDEAKVESLVQDAGIVRHRGKIKATINNARIMQELLLERGQSLDQLIWSFFPEPGVPLVAETESEYMSPTSEEGDKLAKMFRDKGMKFIGPKTVHAFLQAAGYRVDHVHGCLSLSLPQVKQ